MDEVRTTSSKYHVEIRDACGVVIGDNARVEQHFHLTPTSTSFSRPDLLAAIHHANADLRTSCNTIAGIHLDRAEVAEIVVWATSSDPNQRVGMLLDQPGGGKTVIMRDVLARLEAAKVPVLAIKADNLSGVKNRSDLKDWLGLPIDLEECVGQLAAEGRFIILLDQVDALSLTLTRDQATLEVMLSTLARLRELENVRIIVSCRTFDLRNDPRLSGITLDRKFELHPLEDAEVDRVLQAVRIDPAHLLPGHRTLLKVPLHLDIYVRSIFEDAQQLPLENFKSLQELYGALWRRKVEMISPGAPTVSERCNAVYRLVDVMTKMRQVNAPDAVLDDYADAARHLEKEGLLRREKGRWFFLHPTLFDYCYARRFVAGSRSLSQEVLSGSQGLFERSQIVQVLAYLRGTERSRYLRELTDVLLAPSLRIHLCLLILGWLGALPDPEDDELAIVRRWATDSERRALLMRLLAGSAVWFDLLDRIFLPGHLATDDGAPAESAIYYLRSLINPRTGAVLRRLRPYLGRAQTWDAGIAYCLSYLEDWNDSEALDILCDLLARGATSGREDSCLHHLASSNPAGGCRVLRAYLDERLDSLLKQAGTVSSDGAESDSGFGIRYRDGPTWSRELLGEYAVDELLTTAAQAAPLETVEHLLPWFLRAVWIFTDEASPPKDAYPSDTVFSWGWYEDHRSEGATFGVSMGQALGAVARSMPSLFRSLVERLASTSFLAIHRVIAHAYLAHPITYADDIAAYLLEDMRRLDIGDYSDSHYDSYRLYGAAFAHVDAGRRVELETLILDWRPEWEKRRRKNWGSTQLSFLKNAPRQLLSERALRRLQELEHKFPRFELRPPLGVVSWWIGPPISQESQAKMSDEAWLGAMRKYDDTTEWGALRDDPLKGGVVQLSRAFQEQSKTSPERFYRLAQRFDASISTYYIEAAISGLAESTAPAEWVFDLTRQFAVGIQGEFRRGICRALEKRADAGVPDDLLDMIADWALHDASPEQEIWLTRASNGRSSSFDDALQFGINTNRGAAVEVLCHCAMQRKPPQVERGFQMLEQAADDPSAGVRACVIHHLGSFLNHDEARSLDIFERAMEGHPILLQSQVTERLLYRCYRRNFSRLRRYIEAMLGNADDKTRQAGARLACLAAFHNAEAGDLADRAMQGDKVMRQGATQVYACNLGDWDVGQICESRLRHLMDDPDEDVRAEAGKSFRFLTSDHLDLSRSFIDAFLASPALTLGASPLIEYLKSIACDDCDLTLKAVEHILEIAGGQLFDISTHWARLEDHLAQLPLAVYNCAADSATQVRAMDLFERLLVAGSRSAHGALADWDRR